MDKKKAEVNTDINIKQVFNDSILKSKMSYSVECNFIYDTISNEKYNMHLAILNKYNNKDKRGYFYTRNDDTLNHFLYHQDISAFTTGLDSTESGIYKKLTNKVIFLILEQEPRMLDYGLTQWIRDEKQLDYFMKNVSNPTCNTLPIDSTIKIIEEEMGEPHERAKRVKKRLIKELKKAKTRHTNNMYKT